MDKKFENILKIIAGVLVFLIVSVALIEDLNGPRIVKVSEPDFLSNSRAELEIEFNKLMDRKSVESNLNIEPVLPVKFYWQGNKLILEPEQSWMTGTDYSLTVSEKAMDESGRNLAGEFLKELRTPKSEVIYVGTEGEEKNKIIVRDLEGRKVREYLDGNFLIKKFQVNQKDQELIILAKNLNETQGFEIFSLNLKSGEMKNLFAEDNYQNVDVNLSRTAEYLIVGRIEVEDGQYLSKNQLWLARREGEEWGDLQKINNAFGSKGIFSPNDVYITALDEQENFQLIDLDNLHDERQFIGKFRKVWDFHPNKALILLDKFVDQITLNSQLVLFDGNGQMELLSLPVGGVSLARFSNDGKYIWIFMKEQTEAELQLDSGKSFIYKYDWLSKKMEKVLESELENFDEGDWSIDDKYMLIEKIDKLEAESLGASYRNIEIDLEGEAKGVSLAIFDLENGRIIDLNQRGYNLKFLYE